MSESLLPRWLLSPGLRLPSLPILPLPNKQIRRGREIERVRKCLKRMKLFPLKNLSPKKGKKITKGAQRKTSVEGKGAEVVAEHRPSVPTLNPPLELDGAPLPLDSSIRDF